jgi:amino acid adenylation domain-containing protein
VNFGLDPQGQQLQLTLQYESHEFSEEQIQQIAGYYERALEAIARAPEGDYEKVELLDQAERDRLLKGWNETAVDYTGGSCLEELFEEQVARSGNEIALVFGTEQLTYRELNERANQLAHFLKRRGVGPEVLVGVCQERSIELVVSLLAILKAGGAYVPFDPEYPQERLRFLIADTGVRVVLTQERWREKLAGNETEVVSVDQLWEELKQESGANLEHASWGEKLAYVIYTSGSTGEPKGAMNTHAGIRNRLQWMQSQYPLGVGDRVLQKTPYSFDVSVWEFFWPLLTGARLVLAVPGGHQDNGYLEQVIKTEEITVVHFVPSMLRQFLEEPGVESCGTLRRVVSSGEALGYDLQQRFFQRLNAELLNLYGPTETSVEVTYWECERDSELQTVPIGYPIANSRMHVLNGQMQAVPVGVAGELYIGGRGVGRGYLGRAELTSERFVPDPYSEEEGARLYRTGDVVRYLPNGAIEYLGRVDHQVKIRGFRIELAEIEQALAGHPAIKDCVVTASADGDHKRLVAFIVAAPDQAPNNSELFKYLKEKLPEYMVPSTFVLLSELPLNAHGKVDRNALPAPGGERPLLDREYVAPRTPEEELLAGIWSQVLGIREIGVRDNFFELGGHSLLATQIISRTREAFQVDLPLRALFESPTVAELVERIELQRSVAQDQEQAPPLITIERTGRLPLSFAQQRLWFLDQLEPGLSFYNLSAAIRLTGDLDVEALEQTLTEISQRHESLRTTFHDIDGQPVQLISEPRPIKLSVEDLSSLSDEDRQSTLQRMLREESNRPFDLQHGPLFRTALWRLAEQEHVLLTTMHHIISDGWSMSVFFRELVLLYEAHRSQQPLALPELPVQPADFAHWQRQWMQGDVLQAQLDYWRTRLGGPLPLLDLPADRARPATPSYRGAMEMFLFPADIIEPLQKLSRNEGVTLFMMLLAAWQILLYRYAGQPDVVTGSVIANRNRPEIEGLIGFFVNTLVLRTDLSGNPSFRELLVRVREICLGAYAHQDVPFEQLVEVLQPERAASHMPLFRVMFSFQAAPAAGIELPSLKMDMLELDIETSPFDLSLSLAAGPEGPLAILVRYSTDLFDAGTIKRTIKHYETLLRSIVTGPETQIDDLEIYTQAEKDQKAQEKSGRKELKLQKLKNLKPKALNVSTESLIRTEYLPGGTKLPLVIQPQVEGINLATWAGANREFIEREVLLHGAVLFRNFQLNSLVKFEQFAETLCPDLMTYSERSSPRGTLGGHVYTSTTHPAEQSIHLHNEHSYTLRWPMKLWFYCVEPAPQGGRTPIADSRNILSRIDPRIVEKFIEKQIMYVRNYGDGLGLPWQEVFQTSDRSAVEEYCRRNAIEVEWKDDNRLRTRQVRPAVRKHPRSGVRVWFNHAAFFHVTNLEEVERQSTLSVLSEDELPFNTFYGDGSPIEPSFLEEVRAAYREETVSFPWQKEDILMLDNMLVAHGRDPYSGPRKIVFIMADPIQNPDQTNT